MFNARVVAPTEETAVLGRILIALVLAWLVALPATRAHAEELPISPEALAMLLPSSGAHVLQYEADEYRVEGRTEGCGVSFQYLFRDWAYRDNAPTVAYGSVVYFWPPSKQPSLLFKLGIVDLKPTRTSITRKHAKPNYAYIEINGSNMAGREYRKLRFKDAGSIHMAYLDDEKFTLLTEMVSLKGLVVSFNREKGGIDLSHDLLSKAPHTSTGLASIKITTCLAELLKGRLDEPPRP